MGVMSGESRLATPFCLLFAACIASVVLSADERTIDGTNNNLANTDWGSTNIQLRRSAGSAYEDGISSLAGATRPSARVISNTLMGQACSVLDPRGLSDMIWQWGQFLDHDIGLTPPQEEGEGEPVEKAPISVPAGDPFFDREGTGSVTLNFDRSVFDHSVPPGQAREQINILTAWIDGSGVYGENEARATALREGVDGLMKTSAGDLLPFNTMGLVNEDALDLPPETLFIAGDRRANEQIGLFASHTLFVREHNTLARAIRLANPGLTDEEIYQRARRIVGAEIQAITYNEFLATLLGEDAISPYTGYDPSVDGSLTTEFTTAAFRLGHTMLSSNIALVADDGSPVEGGSIGLREAFFVPDTFASVGIGPVMNGLAAQPMQKVDLLVIDDVRNFLFGEPSMGGRDLPSLNIQRGRDHGISDYNSVRAALGLPRKATFEDITGESEVAARMESLYMNVDNIDLWIGLLAEPLVDGASVGETLMAIMVDQFESLRDGDRFFYLNDSELRDILLEIGVTMAEFESDFSLLSSIIKRNTGFTNIQDNVFIASCPGSDVKCQALSPSAGPVLSQRTFDGSENNIEYPERGAIDTQLLRLTPAAYGDGVSSLAGPSRSSARLISNELMSQATSVFDPNGLSDMVWQFGQFLDHDLGLSPPGDTEPEPIPVPKGDVFFDPRGLGNVTLDFERSIFDENVPSGQVRQQTNVLTTWIDGSNVYGSDEERALALRTMMDGRMKVSLGNFLPFNLDDLENEDALDLVSSTLFLAGDIRVNEQIGLVAMHTLFVREHNRLANIFKEKFPCLTDEEIYQRARRVVGAILQAITYNEFVPAVIGSGVLTPYTGYNASVDGTLFTEFTTAAFRLGHTMLSSSLALIANDDSPVQGGSIPLREAFFNTTFYMNEGLDPVLKGLLAQQMQKVDLLVIDDVRNFLFGEPGNGGRDLPSLNIQRGRDHGLGDYNSLRKALNLAPKTSFEDITGETAIAKDLHRVYGCIDAMDLWIGLLAEPLAPGASVGETLQAILALQFQNLRDGDRFFYAGDADLARVLGELNMTIAEFESDSLLSKVIMRNTFLTDLQENAFISSCEGPAQCEPSRKQTCAAAKEGVCTM